jgi:hypothetical protein
VIDRRVQAGTGGSRTLNEYIEQHFDAHLDTWDGSEYPGAVTASSEVVSGFVSPGPIVESALTIMMVKDPWVFLLESERRGPDIENVIDPRWYQDKVAGESLPLWPSKTSGGLT